MRTARSLRNKRIIIIYYYYKRETNKTFKKKKKLQEYRYNFSVITRILRHNASLRPSVLRGGNLAENRIYLIKKKIK